MKHYEVTFIVDPVLSGDEIKTTAKTYEDMLSNEGAKIVHVDQMGLRQLAYPINRRSSGIYYSIEFGGDIKASIAKVELALRRDERIMRFLTIGLDRYGIKYNEDKRNGKFAKKKKTEDKEEAVKPAPAKAAAKPAPVKKTAPAPAPEPVVAAAPAVESSSNEEE